MEKKMNKFFSSLPFILTLIIFIFLLYFTLQNKDPSNPPSVLLNKKMPPFQTSNLLNKENILDEKLILEKKVLINFFASWCSPCKIEHQILMKIAQDHKDILILGFNHKDKENDALNFINKLGNPYDFIGIDDLGKIAMDFGVYGLPETFIIDKNGIIVFKHLGPMTEKLYNDEINKYLSN